MYLALPTDIVKREISSERLRTPLGRVIEQNNPDTEEFVMDQIETRVKEAEGDVICLVDACVRRYDATKQVMDFLTHTGFPVYAAPMGKTAVDENYERYGGVSIS